MHPQSLCILPKRLLLLTTAKVKSALYLSLSKFHAIMKRDHFQMNIGTIWCNRFIANQHFLDIFYDYLRKEMHPIRSLYIRRERLPTRWAAKSFPMHFCRSWIWGIRADSPGESTTYGKCMGIFFDRSYHFRFQHTSGKSAALLNLEGAPHTEGKRVTRSLRNDCKMSSRSHRWMIKGLWLRIQNDGYLYK